MNMNWIKRIIGGHTSDESDVPKRTSPRESPPLGPLIDDDETLVGEFTRARRYEQTLTIAVASPAQMNGRGRRARSNGDGAGGPDVLPLLAAAGLREALRESDVVCYRPMDDRFVLGFPQSDGDEARQAMARVGELFRKHLDMDLMAGAASFPADGLTLEDLENTARARSEAVGPEAKSVSTGDVGPSLEVPSLRSRARPRGRRPRPSSPSGSPREAVGSSQAAVGSSQEARGSE